jgi:hypothetical protein
MLRTAKALLATSMLVISLPLLAIAGDKDEMMDNPKYTGWAGHKVGATATLVEKTTYTDDKNPVADQKVITYTLLSVSPEKVVVRAVVVEPELLGTIESAPTKHHYPAKLKKSYLAVAAPDLDAKNGEETIKWKDKELNCKTLYGSYKREGETVEFKAWIYAEIPGGVVKQTRTSKQKDETIVTTTTLRSYKPGK